MWIAFETDTTEDGPERFVIKPFVGGVNGISGESMIGDMATLARQLNSISPKQDYIVLPEQMWLDGIATSPGRVKQFVATPMLAEYQQSLQSSNKQKNRESESQDETKSSETTQSFPTGTSVEYQVTGRESVGGIQLHIIPQHDTSWMSFSNVKNVCYGKWGAQGFNLDAGRKRLDALRTPSELGFQPGDILHLKNMREAKPNRPKVLEDLLFEKIKDQSLPTQLSFQCENGIVVSTDILIHFDEPTVASLQVQVRLSICLISNVKLTENFEGVL
jgi:hypothetical protein